MSSDFYRIIGICLGLLLVGGLLGGPVVFFWILLRKKPRNDDEDDEDTPHCEKCGYDLRSTPCRCPECGWIKKEKPIEGFDLQKLREDWPTTRIACRKVEPWEELVTVHETDNGWLTQLLAEQFLARGVWCEQTRTNRSEVVGAVARSFAHFAIVVAKDDLEAAQAIMERCRMTAVSEANPDVSPNGQASQSPR